MLGGHWFGGGQGYWACCRWRMVMGMIVWRVLLYIVVGGGLLGCWQGWDLGMLSSVGGDGDGCW